MAQIYNEEINDLLGDVKKKLDLKEDPKKGVVVAVRGIVDMPYDMGMGIYGHWAYMGIGTHEKDVRRKET